MFIAHLDFSLCKLWVHAPFPYFYQIVSVFFLMICFFSYDSYIYSRYDLWVVNIFSLTSLVLVPLLVVLFVI